MILNGIGDVQVEDFGLHLILCAIHMCIYAYIIICTLLLVQPCTVLKLMIDTDID